MPGNPSDVSTKLQRIAHLAERTPKISFTSLAYMMDIEWLKEAYRRTRKGGVPGVDGQTAQDYAEKLEDNLKSLLDRAKSGRYRAPSVRRTYIPKGSGKEVRAIGVPTFEDKVLQRAVVMLMEPIYERDFFDCSFGFRPGRSAHDALQSLWKQTMDIDGGWLLEVDIRSYFDRVDRAHLREFLKTRVCDGVISPLLANVYLHYVLDTWFIEEVQPRLKGRSFLIRYGDDFVIGFSDKRDTERVMEVLPQRFGKYGLELHPDKTRLIPFHRPSDDDSSPDGGCSGKPGTFNFLGFTHYWGKSRKGRWVVKRKTASDRLSRALRKLNDWCRSERHSPIKEQHAALCRKLRGHYNYYGITGNSRGLRAFLYWVERIWRKWLARRNRERKLCWEKFKRLLRRYSLPPPVAYHSIYRCTANL